MERKITCKQEENFKRKNEKNEKKNTEIINKTAKI